ncbi:MAG: aminoacetone oxidase family FAD-binding enzyme, partial [Syntrophales bacterium]
MTKSLDRLSANRLIVIGAGASGLMAAGRAAEMGAEVLLLEKMEKPGKKILWSGKTRCNLTNIKSQAEFIAMYGSNGRFLYSAFNCFFRDDLLALLKLYGVDTKVERGGRIFPTSDRASDVVAALRYYASDHGVKMETGSRVTGLEIGDGSLKGVRLENGIKYGGAVILATGGASCPSTGSTGDGFRMAEEAGHSIVGIRPALVPLIVNEVQLASGMQ